MDRIRSIFGRTQQQRAENHEDVAAPANINAQQQGPRADAGRHQQASGPSASLRFRRLIRPHQSVGNNSFENKSPSKKIDWLLRAVRESKEGRDPYLSHIAVGTRRLSKKEALCFALEIGIEFERNKVPGICQQLLANYEAENMSFTLFGVPFSRARVADWAREGMTNTGGITVNSIANREIQNLGKSLYQDNRQNVHSPEVMIAMAGQLMTIANRVPEEQRCSRRHAEGELKNYLQSTQADDIAMNGFALVKSRDDQMNNFDHSVRGTLTVLWNYIRNVPDAHLKSQLKIALTAKLREIGNERPCATGMIERLIDTPTAIDWSITQKLSLEHLRHELQTMAGVVSEEMDAENADYLQMLRNEAGPSQSTTETDELMTVMKRDRFLATVDVDLGMVRGIERQLVKTEAERVFPEGVTL